MELPAAASIVVGARYGYRAQLATAADWPQCAADIDNKTNQWNGNNNKTPRQQLLLKADALGTAMYTPIQPHTNIYNDLYGNINKPLASSPHLSSMPSVTNLMRVDASVRSSKRME